MKSMIKIEFKRAFQSRTFYLSLFIGMAICIVEYVLCVIPNALNILYGVRLKHSFFPQNVFESWIAQSVDGRMYFSIYNILTPLLSVLAYGGSYCIDRKSGYIKNIYSRGNKASYLYAKYFASIIAGGVAVILPLIVNLMATAAVLPSLIPEPTNGSVTSGSYLWSSLFFSKPYVFILLHFILIFFYQMMYVGVALAVSEFSEHVFLVWLFPFLFNYFIDAILNFFGSPFSSYAPLSILQFNYIGADLGGLLGLLIQWIIVMTFVTFLYIGKGVRDETY